MVRVGAVEAVIVTLVCLLALSLIVSRTNSMVDVKSGVDRRRYVVRNLADRQQAADMLARVNQRLIRLVNHMRTSFPGDADVAFLLQNFSADNVTEASGRGPHTSYSQDKGRKIALCLRTRDASRRLQDLNLIMYVAVHELAHLMTREIGHTDAFWANNKRLLKEAIAIGVYQRVDFAAAPVRYCGLTISTSVI